MANDTDPKAFPQDKNLPNRDPIIRQTDCQYSFGKEAISLTLKFMGDTKEAVGLAAAYRSGTRVKVSDLTSKFTELNGILPTSQLEATGRVTASVSSTRTGSGSVSITVQVPYKAKISIGGSGGSDDPEKRIIVTWSEKSTDYEFPLEIYAGEGQSASEANAGNLEAWKNEKTKNIENYKNFKYSVEGQDEPVELEGRTKELAKKIYKGIESVRRAYPEVIRTTQYLNLKADKNEVDETLIKQIDPKTGGVKLYYRDQTPDSIWKGKFPNFDWLYASYDVNTEVTEYQRLWNVTVSESWIGIDKKERGTWDDDLYGNNRWPFADITGGQPSPSPEEDASTPTTDIEWNDGTTQQTDSLRGRFKSTSISDIQSVSRVDFGNQVYAIDDSTFSGCTKLRQVTMPEVSHIGTSAFEGTTLLPMVELSEKITSMGTSAFKNSGLMGATIKPSIYELPSETFNNCTNLSVPSGSSGLQVGGSINSVGEGAFQGCSTLQAIEFKNKVTSIGQNAFDGCFALTTVKVPQDETGTLTLGDGAFSYCQHLGNIELPVGTITVGTDVFGNYAFSELAGPVRVKAPKSLLASIPSSVTYDYEYPAFVTSIANDEFRGDTRLKSIEVTETITSLGNNMCNGCTSLERAVFKPSVTDSGTSTFGLCSALTDLEIGGNTLTTLGLNFAKNCTSLVNLTITAPLTTLADSNSTNNGVFRGCSALTSISLPDTLTTIGGSAFYGCWSLTELTIPSSVTSIGASALNIGGTSNPPEVTMVGKDMATVQAMTDYPWGLRTGSTVHCTDGDITIS